MTGIVLIRDTPYMALTDDTGWFEIRNLPAGNWKFRFWHERIGDLQLPEHDSLEVACEIKTSRATNLGIFTLPGDSIGE